MGLPDRSDTGFAAPTVGGCAAIDRAVLGESRIGLGQLTEWQWEWLWSSVPEILRSGESAFGQRARSRNPWNSYRSEETSRAAGGGGSDGEGERGEEEALLDSFVHHSCEGGGFCSSSFLR